MLTNNLAYVLALNGEVNEAESLMSNPHLYDSSTPIDSLVCHIATKGLIEFRRKHSDEGRRLYTEAINLANERCDDKTLVRKAILNYLREEIIANGCTTSDIEPIITQINPGNDREMCQLQTDVISEMENKSKDRIFFKFLLLILLVSNQKFSCYIKTLNIKINFYIEIGQ